MFSGGLPDVQNNTRKKLINKDAKYNNGSSLRRFRYDSRYLFSGAAARLASRQDIQGGWTRVEDSNVSPPLPRETVSASVTHYGHDIGFSTRPFAHVRATKVPGTDADKSTDTNTNEKKQSK